MGFRVWLMVVLLAWACVARAGPLVIEICTGTAEVPNISGDCGTASDIFGVDSGDLNEHVNAVQVRDTTSGEIVRIPLAPGKEWPVPANWSGATDGTIDPIPPDHTALGSAYAGEAGGDAYCQVWDSVEYCNSTVVALASELGVVMCAVYGGPPDCTYTSDATGLDWIVTGTVMGIEQDPNTGTASVAPCPAGYVVNGGSTECDLSNAALVVKPPDDIMNVKRAGGVFTADSKDADTTGITSALNVSVSGSQLIAGNNEDGGLLVVKLLAEGTSALMGNYICLESVCYAVLSGSYPGAGVNSVTVTGVNVGTASGVAGLPSFSGSGAGWGGAGWTWGAGTGGGAVTGGSGEALGTEATLSEIRDSLDADGLSSALTAQESALDAAVSTRIGDLSTETSVTDLGLGLTIEWPTGGGCNNPSFAMFGKGDLVVPLCERRDDIQASLNWLVAIVTAIALFGIGSGAVGARG